LAKPEWLRKISSIINAYVIIDIVSYGIGIYNMISWIIIVSQMADSPSLPVSDTDYLNYFGKLADNTERYLFFASINLLLLYLRFLKYARISKSLTFL